MPNLSGYIRTIQAYFNNTNHPRRTALHSFGYTQSVRKQKLGRNYPALCIRARSDEVSQQTKAKTNVLNKGGKHVILVYHRHAHNANQVALHSVPQPSFLLIVI